MKFNALRDFLAVAERGSLRAAARQLGSAQAALSHSIQELENELGVVLFERGSQGVTLTPMGQVFLRRATAVFEELRRAREELEQLRGGAHGSLAIAMSSVPHLALYPGALRPFRQRYPDARKVIAVVGPEGGLTNEEIELARQHDFKIVGLGPRVLRTETAAIVTVAICQHLWGDLGRRPPSAQRSAL